MLVIEDIGLGFQHHDISLNILYFLSSFAVGASTTSLNTQLDVLEVFSTNVTLQIHRLFYVDRAKETLISAPLNYIVIIEVVVTLSLVGSPKL